MPTVLQLGSYRFFFYSADKGEPYHVHVEKDKSIAKVWLKPIRLEYSRIFSRVELNKILKTVEENKDFLIRSWDEYFNN